MSTFNLTHSHLPYTSSWVMWGNHSINYWKHLNHNLHKMKSALEPLLSLKCKLTSGTQNLSHRGPYPIDMKHYDLTRSGINKLLDAQVIHSSPSSWSAHIIVVPKEDGGKCLVIDCRALNKVTWKFIWPMPRVEGIFSKLNGAMYFSPLNLLARYYHIPLNEDYFHCNFYISFWEIWISESSFWISTSTGIFPRTDE